MSSSPQVTVVIPLYNAAPYISETLDSIAAQTYPAAEVVIVDDGSSDDGAEIARQHSLQPKVLQQANAGPARARNAGVAASSGELITFQDAEDLWYPTKLEEQVAVHLEKPQVGLIYSDLEYFSVENGQRQVWSTEVRPLKQSLRCFLISNQLSTITAMIPRRVWNAVGQFDECPSLIGAEDYDYWLRIRRRYPVHFVPRNLSQYRHVAGGLVGHDWDRNVIIQTRPVARMLAREPILSWRYFGLPPLGFLRWRLIRHLARSVLVKRHQPEHISLSGQGRVVRHLLFELGRIWREERARLR